MNIRHFNPGWSDLKIDEKVLNIPLYLPNSIERNTTNSIWIERQKIYEESCNGNTLKLNYPREMVLILRKSNAGDNANLTFYDSKTNRKISSEEQNTLYDFVFPPRVWMSDSLQERSMMYNAAKEAKNKILIGGLGLGLYMQFALFLNRPVDSITIVENNKEIIEFIGNPLLEIYEDADVNINIIHGDVEKFMESSDEKFDTIYLDTWGDLHIKFLSYINYMIDLAKRLMTEKGMIYCWGYNHMYEDFQNLAVAIEKDKSMWDKLNIEDNIVLGEYIVWRKKLKYNPSKNELIEKAKDIALNTKSEIRIELSIDLPSSKWMRTKII